MPIIIKTLLINLVSSLRNALKSSRDQFADFYKSNRFFSCVLIFYCLITSALYLHNRVLVFDEAWFYHNGFKNAVGNHLGYGYLYWLLISIVRSLFLLRVLSLISIFSIPFVIYKFGKKFNITPDKIKLVILLWLTYPAAWWFGKLIGVELYCNALGFYGLYLAMCSEKFEKNQTIGILLMSLATALKISYVIFPFFYYFYSLINCVKINRFFFKSLLSFAKETRPWLFFTGVIVFSPDLIFYPEQHINNLLRFSRGTPNFYLANMIYTSNLGDFWETVINPSLLWFSLSISCIVFLLITWQWWRILNIKLAISFVGAFILSTIMLMKSYSYFSWFWFPIITLSSLFFLSLKCSKKYLVAIIIINLISNSPVIFVQTINKISSIKNSYYTRSIKSVVAKHRANFVKSFPNHKECISINPEHGSCILRINEYLLQNDKIEDPFLLAVNKSMMVKYANVDTVYDFIYHNIFNDDEVETFKNKIFELKKLNYNVVFLEEIHDTYIFTISPN